MSLHDAQGNVGGEVEGRSNGKPEDGAAYLVELHYFGRALFDETHPMERLLRRDCFVVLALCVRE